MTSIPYYLVGDKKIYSQYKAWEEIIRSRQAFRFVCYEEEYDKVDWTKEPLESWDQICKNKCTILRQKYKKLSLFYSAGRDSHHILTCFDRFNIPLDELILIERPLSPLRRNELHSYIWPKAKEYQAKWPKCNIKVLTIHDKEFEMYFKDDWLEKDSMSLSQGLFQPVQYSWFAEKLIKAEPTHGIIVGLEKPRILLEDGKFFSVILDKSVEIFLHKNQNFELFYYSPDYPELHIKQTWMMLNYIEKHYFPVTSDLLNSFCANAGTIYYDEFCRSCGRGPAWNLNLSIQNGGSKYHLGGTDPQMQVGIDYALKENWNSIFNFNQAFNYLRQTIPEALNNGDPRLGTVGVWGKKYYLKDQVYSIDVR